MNSPLPKVRRVVTGHDASNKAKVLLDGTDGDVQVSPLGTRRLLWSTVEMPCDVAIGESIEDEGLRTLGTQPPPNGSRFTVNDLPPGCSGQLHRTESLDYAVLLSGEVDLELDDGQRVSLNPGDIVIQRATNHAWINRGTNWARLLFVLLDAKPLGIGEALTAGAVVGMDRNA